MDEKRPAPKGCPDKHPWDELSRQDLFLLAKYHEARADQLEKIVMTALCGLPDQVHRMEYTGEVRDEKA